VGRRGLVLAAGLAVLTIVDLLTLNVLLRPVFTAPIRLLVDQSPVLAKLARFPRGSRMVDDQGNLAMVAGLAPIYGYRTLDRPILGELTWLATQPPWRDHPLSQEARRAVGLRLGVVPLWDGISPREPARIGTTEQIVYDPERTRWNLGERGLGRLGREGATFAIWEPQGDVGVRAWFLTTPTKPDAEELRRQDDNTGRLLQRMRTGRPLPLRSTVPERVTLEVEADGAGFVLITQLDDPNWEGTWSGPAGERPAALVRLFGNAQGAGWQATQVPGPGRWTLRLAYRPRSATRGLAASLVAWCLWAMAYWKLGRITAVPGSEGELT
jgi:hypothetical protein